MPELRKDPVSSRWVIISTGVLAQIRRLYTTMGRADLIDTPLCANQKERYKHKDEIDAYGVQSI